MAEADRQLQKVRASMRERAKSHVDMQGGGAGDCTGGCGGGAAERGAAAVRRAPAQLAGALSLQFCLACLLCVSVSDVKCTGSRRRRQRGRRRRGA
eukprot:1715574-Rhodomonas_salina.3